MLKSIRSQQGVSYGQSMERCLEQLVRGHLRSEIAGGVGGRSTPGAGLTAILFASLPAHEDEQVQRCLDEARDRAAPRIARASTENQRAVNRG
jgi:hypothetical protein